PLPVYIDDPVERLRAVQEGMGQLKESKQALGAEVIAGLNEFAPPTLLAQASRLNFSTRLFNLIVTNVPGPQFPLYLLGREMQEIVPIAFLPENHALAVAIMSYNGKVDFGLLADYDALPDIDAFADNLVRTRTLAAIAAAATTLLSAHAAQAAPPLPFGHACTSRDGVLFCPTAGDSQRVPSWDGVPLDVDVTLPSAGDGPFPVIVMMHGWGGNKGAFEAAPGATITPFSYNNVFYA